MNLLAKRQKVYGDLRGNEARLNKMETKESLAGYPDIGTCFALPLSSANRTAIVLLMAIFRVYVTKNMI